MGKIKNWTQIERRPQMVRYSHDPSFVGWKTTSNDPNTNIFVVVSGHRGVAYLYRSNLGRELIPVDTWTNELNPETTTIIASGPFNTIKARAVDWMQRHP